MKLGLFGSGLRCTTYVARHLLDLPASFFARDLVTSGVNQTASPMKQCVENLTNVPVPSPTQKQ